MKRLAFILLLFLATSCVVERPTTKYWHRKNINLIAQQHAQTTPHKDTYEINRSLRPQGGFLRKIMKAKFY